MVPLVWRREPADVLPPAWTEWSSAASEAAKDSSAGVLSTSAMALFSVQTEAVTGLEMKKNTRCKGGEPFRRLAVYELGCSLA